MKGLETTLAERRTEFDKLGERLAQLEKQSQRIGMPVGQASACRVLIFAGAGASQKQTG